MPRVRIVPYRGKVVIAASVAIGAIVPGAQVAWAKRLTAVPRKGQSSNVVRSFIVSVDVQPRHIPAKTNCPLAFVSHVSADL